MKTWLYFLLTTMLFISNLYAQGPVLCGTCTLGGRSDSGTIFEYFVANDSLAKVFDFGGSKGASPIGRLLQATDGKIYGVTNYGGVFNTGVLFQFDPDSQQYKKIHDFTSEGGAFGGLIQFGNKLYGLGETDIYSYDIAADTFVEELDFDTVSVDNPALPHGDPTLFNNELYGVTWYGGANNDGLIFKYDPTSMLFTPLYNFTNDYGQLPTGKITVANGKLYLMGLGGPNLASIMEYDPITDTVNDAYDFGPDLVPTGSLLLAADGNLYGFVDSGIGMSYNYGGELFEYVPGSGTIAIKYGFDSVYSQNSPGANLVQATNGLLYCADETIYSFDYNTNQYTILRAFNDSIGSYPFNGLIQIGVIQGIEDVKANGILTLYPNPAMNEVTIQNVYPSENMVISVVDATGRTLITKYTTVGSKIVFDIHNLSPGIYTVELKQEDSNYTGRFVKMN